MVIARQLRDNNCLAAIFAPRYQDVSQGPLGMNGGSSALYLARTSCDPLFCTLSNSGGNRRAFGLPGAGGDHFHCAVEPSPDHIRCRLLHICSTLSDDCAMPCEIVDWTEQFCEKIIETLHACFYGVLSVFPLVARKSASIAIICVHGHEHLMCSVVSLRTVNQFLRFPG